MFSLRRVFDAKRILLHKPDFDIACQQYFETKVAAEYSFLVFGSWFKIRLWEKFYVGEGVCNDCITVVFRPDTF